MKIKKEFFVVTAVDGGDTCDGKPTTLFIAETREEAEAFVRIDMDQWARGRDPDVLDYARMSAVDGLDSCEWNVEPKTAEFEVGSATA